MDNLLEQQLRSTRAVTAAAARLVRVCSEVSHPIELTTLARAYGIGDFNMPEEFLELVRRAQ